MTSLIYRNLPQHTERLHIMTLLLDILPFSLIGIIVVSVIGIIRFLKIPKFQRSDLQNIGMLTSSLVVILSLVFLLQCFRGDWTSF